MYRFISETNVEYFERIEKETAQEIIKSKEKDTVKARLNQLDETITMAQLKQKVEKRDNVISKFKDEVEALKKELSEVKNRNKKLCNMLGQGESVYLQCSDRHCQILNINFRFFLQ